MAVSGVCWVGEEVVEEKEVKVEAKRVIVEGGDVGEEVVGVEVIAVVEGVGVWVVGVELLVVAVVVVCVLVLARRLP